MDTQKTIKPALFFLAALLFFPAAASSADGALTLEAALREARGKNLLILQAEEEVMARRFALAEEKTYFYPTVSVSGGYSYYRRQGDPLGAFMPVEGDSSRVSFSLRQPLYTGGALQARTVAAEKGLEAAETGLEELYLDLELHVARAYVSALRADRLLAVAGELVQNRRRHLADVTAMVREGALPPFEQLRSEVELADSENAMMEAENNRRSAYSNLNRLLERPLEGEPGLVDILSDAIPEIEPLSFFEKKALEHRPEIALSRIATEQARTEEKLARSALYPEVSLTLGREYTQDDAFRSSWRDSDSLAIVFSSDIWNRGRFRKRLEQAGRRVEQRLLREEQTGRDIMLEVRKAHLELLSARGRIGAVAKAIEQAQEVLRVQRIRFSEGMSTSTEVMDAEFALARAQTNYYGARYDFFLAEAALRRSTGEMVLAR